MKLTIILPAFNEEKLVKRALDSIPLSKDYQYILIDDGSTDKTPEIMEEWFLANENKMGENSTFLPFDRNYGIAEAMNTGFDLAEGEYIVSLSADDYFIKNFSPFAKYLDGKNDLIYFDLQVNNGEVWHVDEKTKYNYVGAVKFIRNEFLADTRIPRLKYREDAPFSEELYNKNPREVFTGIILKHYNFPHRGSLTWQALEDDERKQNETTK